jgi:class 3 adenylate cyclase
MSAPNDLGADAPERSADGAVRYREPPPDGRGAMELVPANGAEDGQRFRFWGGIEIGRDDGREPEPGVLLLRDPTISRKHCVITRLSNGRCFVRDVSRNGTRLDGRRLLPNVETEWHVGHAITVGTNRVLVLSGDPATAAPPREEISTIPVTGRAVVTVLVGDIRDYTVLVRRALSEELQRAVGAVFGALSEAIVRLGGTVKEYQGDAIVAFWEGDAKGGQAVKACRAALAVDALAASLSADPSRWPFPEHPLELDWALATGLVLIDSVGRGEPTGLSMMGEPVVRAFRLEKFASDATGRILVCSATRTAGRDAFEFRDLGRMLAKGFEDPDHVFALVGERAPKVGGG